LIKPFIRPLLKTEKGRAFFFKPCLWAKRWSATHLTA
jgi:hypothetical protein